MTTPPNLSAAKEAARSIWPPLMVGGLVVLILCSGVVVLLLWPRPAADRRLLQTRSEIEPLGIAVENFKTFYRVGYIPSQIRLAEMYSDYQLLENGAPQDDVLDRDSVNYLASVWPQLLSADPVAAGVHWIKRGIDWNGNGKIDKGKITLEGDQCLVFFLGGIPAVGPPADVIGFATNPRDPASLMQRVGRKPPFFEFPSKRLFVRTSAPAGNAGFFSFADPYGQPYAYFSNYGTRNGYNSPINPRYDTGDCATLNVQPYYQSANPRMFYNPSSFQIVSAGADSIFGPGGLWTPEMAKDMPPAGRDDQTNFHATELGPSDDLRRHVERAVEWLPLLGAFVTGLIASASLILAHRVGSRRMDKGPTSDMSLWYWACTFQVIGAVGTVVTVLYVIIFIQWL
jgi:hypothetical protein